MYLLNEGRQEISEKNKMNGSDPSREHTNRDCWVLFWR